MISTFSGKSDSLNRLKAHMKEVVPSLKIGDGDPPLRAELFNAEQMEQYGKALALRHPISNSISAGDLLGRLSENEEVIIDVHHLVQESLNANHQITPAGEWLLDNFYLIEEHIRLAKMHLPKRYSRELPRLSNGPSAGLPRVYDLAKEVISHGDGRIDSESLRRFIKSYQTVTILSIGELWAIPIMLRFALIENLRRVAFSVALGRIDRNLADFWADQIIDILDKDPKSIILVTADMARSNPPMTPAFVSGFTRRLQGKNSALALPITWVEQRLSQENQTISQLIRVGSQQLAADQVSISNSIAGLRLLGAMDWKDFVEEVSIIDSILRSDPAGVYHKMDFHSRDNYRHAIEKMSKKSALSESEIAREAIQLSLQAQKSKNSADRTAHVGFYIIDKGKYLLERRINRHITLFRKIHSYVNKHPGWIYFGSMILFTVGIVLLLAPDVQKSVLPFWVHIIIYILVTVSVSQLTITLINWVTTLVVPPKKLPRIDFSSGIPSDNRTLVVVPCMLISEEQIEKLAGHLEVRFLANRDPNLLFGLLTDFQDAGSETSHDDHNLVDSVQTRIEELNRKYENGNPACFYLFHRPRKYNKVEKVWMGYERKRGKLADLNSLIKGKSNAFSVIIGDKDRLFEVKYIITLDVDTDLPRDSAHQMIGAMAHPLNRPAYEPKRRIIVDGYTILQPRVAVSLPGSNKSLYAKLFANEPGIDPYTRAISDVYQDMFKEGSFIGKGIYDVDSFERILSNRFPENRILSHDLLEGCYTRSGLLSDTLLFEEYPVTYFTDVKRRHRWIRGDWQLLPWLRMRIHSFNGSIQWNPLSGLSLWKLTDNLRRSLIPLTNLILLIAGWTILSRPWLWTVVIAGFMIIPALIVSLTDMVRKPEGVKMKQHLEGSIKLMVKHLTQSLFQIITLPFEAGYCADAIVRTLWRMIISGKNLLEWNSEASSTRFSYKGLSGLFFSMWLPPLLAVSLFIILIFYFPASLIPASPILLLWIVAPLTVWWLDRPITEQRVRLTEEQLHFLYSMSRRIWAFFEKFVTAEENWLPPDNYQEHPNPIIAHRTSPTNMGLSLLANLTAYDFGYISAGELLNRTSAALDTMKRLEKYHGHFYNWYNTLSLKPLLPLYISSVDSGNLAGAMITLRSGLRDLPDNPIISKRFIGGLKDTLSIIESYAGGKKTAELFAFSEAVDSYPADTSVNIPRIWEYVTRLSELADQLVYSSRLRSDDLLWEWTGLLIKQCHDVQNDLKYLLNPWLKDNRLSTLTFKGIPTLRDLANLDTQTDNTENRISLISELIEVLNRLTDMNYGFLYDKSRKLQSIGFNVDDRRLDAGYYDLLASEARLSTFVAIAQGQIPQESWFAMSRVLTGSDGESILLSWSGSMFEYLMPLIIMPVYENTLIYKACVNAIAKQIEYGKQHSTPWGVSESGYNMFDQNLNYQYKAFGIPGLGLKRGLSDDLVIAPYASMLAILLKPAEACKNMEILASDGFLGKYGFYEAIDYTPSRLPRGQSHVVIKSYMAHHQGMSFLALSGFLLEMPMQKRFQSDSMLQAALLLLQERIPRYSAYHDFSDSETIVRSSIGPQELPIRVYETPHTPYPEVHFLSNGRYHVMLTNSGSGYSRWNELAVSRWREDSTLDNTGIFCYIRDSANGYFWSATYQPTLVKPDRYEVVFSEGRAEFKRRDKEIDTYTEVVVSPEDDIELRRVHLKNRTRNKRVIDIISYSELVLTHSASEATHPAFTNLFVQTEIVYQRQAILATRRPRSAEEKVNWMFHLMAVHGAQINNIAYETDRLKFLGRGNTLERPYALTGLKVLGNSEGSVLDPIAAIQYQIILEPEGTVVIDMVTGMTDARDTAMSLIEKYQDRQLANRVFELAWTHSQVMLQQINAVESDARLYSRLASNIVFPNRSMRPESTVIMRNRRGQSALWGYSISGDLPIILIQVEDPENISLLRQLIQAHSYWRLKGLIVDMVIWIEDFAGYRQILYDQIMAILAGGIESGIVGHPGGIFIRTGDQISVEDRILFQAVARVVISDRNGTLADQLVRHIAFDPLIAPLKASIPYVPDLYNNDADTEGQLEFFNGKGGFTPDGREYIIFTSTGNMTPLPWSNILANSQFGTVVTENGHAYTWSENAHEYRLTPWYNDPVTDKGGEMIYLRDEDTGHFWSPTPFIKTGSKTFKTRHGFGYSIFEHSETGIQTELYIYVSTEAPVKFSVLKVRNNSGRRRKLSATGYVEWVLGELRSKTGMHVVTSIDIDTGAILAHNAYNYEFTDKVSFFQTTETLTCSFTCDRSEFLGRNGSMANPASMKRSKLSGKRGAALDPCAAIQANIEIEEGQQKEIAFILGSAANNDEAINFARRFSNLAAARDELEKVWAYWNNILGCIKAETPDRALNYLVNGWLMYQTLASRIMARSGYYQSGGAYGFRDQLQDAMAVIHCSPQILYDHILLHAGRQFIEGDVQHWWHPPSGRGVRTRCSDDLLWLPLATCRYIISTGDLKILEESVHFLEGRPLNPDEESYYDLPVQSGEKASLYEHCKRAIERSLNFGIHGLPLIGSHDWNDGMNKIGHKGKGESVWLGFFLYDVLMQFAHISDIFGNQIYADKCRIEAEKLQTNLEAHAWDGKWYLRAFFDDGTPLGSHTNAEGKIDSISQSWAVISDAGNVNRTKTAMQSVNSNLVHRDIGIVQLLDPAFDKSQLNPGYIKGYLPGVRENGGQYTHAAIWAIMAFAKLRDKKNAWEILSLINPINHSLTERDSEIYKVEPYVIAADVYSLPPHTGRGGWTWYTGSAGWMYRMIIESLLGLTREGDKLFINPLMPDDWKLFQIDYRYLQTSFKMQVIRSEANAVKGIFLDEKPVKENYIQLFNDATEHHVKVVI